MKTGIFALTAIAGLAALASTAFAAEGASALANATPLRDTTVGGQQAEELAVFINTVHPSIAAPHMKDTQAADIVAYVATLKPK